MCYALSFQYQNKNSTNEKTASVFIFIESIRKASWLC